MTSEDTLGFLESTGFKKHWFDAYYTTGIHGSSRFLYKAAAVSASYIASCHLYAASSVCPTQSSEGASGHQVELRQGRQRIHRWQ